MSGSVPETPVIANPAEGGLAAAASVAPVAPAGVSATESAPTKATGDIGVSPVAAPAAEAPATPELEPSLLETFAADEKAAEDAAKAAEKPAAEVKAEGDKKDAAAPEVAEPVVVPPVAYEYTIPETIKATPEQRAELTTALDQFRADPAKGAQALIDMHAKALEETVKAYDAQTLVRQFETFNGTRKEWRQQIMADEQLGGSGFNTTMRANRRMMDRFVPEKNRAAFESFLRVTGAGDHPEFHRLLHNVAGAFDEPPLPPPNIKPAPDIGKKPGASKAERLYG